MKRITDIALVVLLSPAVLLLFPLIALAIWLADRGPVIYWSLRLGENNTVFHMPKFRTMRTDTPLQATDQLERPNIWITPVGTFLRKFSIDELPQLWCILIGEMSFVGPRPALQNQEDLIKLRTQKCIPSLRPGLTGWAQINGRDMLSVSEKLNHDLFYLKNRSFLLDLKIMCMTVSCVLTQRDISH